MFTAKHPWGHICIREWDCRKTILFTALIKNVLFEFYSNPTSLTLLKISSSKTINSYQKISEDDVVEFAYDIFTYSVQNPKCLEELRKERRG